MVKGAQAAGKGQKTEAGTGLREVDFAHNPGENKKSTWEESNVSLFLFEPINLFSLLGIVLNWWSFHCMSLTLPITTPKFSLITVLSQIIIPSKSTLLVHPFSLSQCALQDDDVLVLKFFVFVFFFLFFFLSSNFFLPCLISCIS